MWLRTLYVLVFIGLQSRRVHLSTTTAHPDSSWVIQQARNLTMDLEDRSPAVRFLIHDRDIKFSGSFDEVFRSGGTDDATTQRLAVRPRPSSNAWKRATQVSRPAPAVSIVLPEQSTLMCHEEICMSFGDSARRWDG